MTITISPETEKRLCERAREEVMSIEAYVEMLIREDEEWAERSPSPIPASDSEFGAVKAAVMEGLDQAQRGEVRPVEQIFAELRAKYDISR
jgi:predicted transcriptional regulator